MENDPNKKESKGKRLFKKAIRRSSKSSNGSQQSALEQGISVTRSKSFENKQRSIEINDSTPLPTPEGPKDKAEHNEPGLRLKEDRSLARELAAAKQAGPSDEVQGKKVVDIQEQRNEVFGEAATDSKDTKLRSASKLDKKNERLEPESSRRGLKRVCFSIDEQP